MGIPHDVVVGLVLAGIGVLLMIRVPVGIALAVPALLGTSVIVGRWEAGASLAVTTIFSFASNSIFVILPLFMLLAALASRFGLMEELFEAGRRWVGRIPGGLALATVWSCGAFGGISGSSIADVAAAAKAIMPELAKEKYSEPFSAAFIAAAGTIAVSIPPSSVLVLYGILAEQSIGRLLIAGIVPGVVQGITFSIVVLLMVLRNPRLAPPTRSYPIREAAEWTLRAWTVPLIFLMILGSIYFGIWTPTEAAAGSAATVLVAGWLRRRATLSSTVSALDQATTIAGSLFLIVGGAFMLGRFLAVSGVTLGITESIISRGWPPWVVLLVLIAVLVCLGFVMEGGSILALVVPLAAPVMLKLGFDGIWLGVLITRVIENGLLVPPLGLNVYTFSTLWPSVKPEMIFRNMVPFYIADLVNVVMLIAFPSLATFLPNAMFSQR